MVISNQWKGKKKEAASNSSQKNSQVFHSSENGISVISSMKSASTSSSCCEGIVPNVTKCTVSFNLNIFGKYASVNPDSNLMVKMISQQTQLYAQG